MSIIDLIKSQLTPELITQTATQLGESESGISKAIGAILPAVVGGLANNSQNPTVLDAISGAHSSGILGNLLGNTSNNSFISTIISAIFGDKINGLINLISEHSGISNSSASSLLNLVTGATLGSVGSYAQNHNLDASGVSNLLGEQKGLLSSLLPAGLSLGSLGLGNLFGNAEESVSATTTKINETISDIKQEIPKTTPTYTSNNNDDNGGGGFWKWLLPLLLLGLASWFLWKQCNKKESNAGASNTDSTIITQDSSAIASSTTDVNGTAKVDTDIDLNGVKIKGFAGGMEDQLISFLKSDGYKNATDDAALKDKWYSFDKVNFKIGKSDQLEEGSQQQLDNLVAILKAYPDAKIKIGGYTDKTGDETKNLSLSKARAEYIKAALAKAGVGAQVLEAEGYGSKFATVPAEATNEERAADRKMAIRFAK
jgi:outer membrane protein OmpA-like peptidoglycan-associated protein